MIESPSIRFSDLSIGSIFRFAGVQWRKTSLTTAVCRMHAARGDQQIEATALVKTVVATIMRPASWRNDWRTLGRYAYGQARITCELVHDLSKDLQRCLEELGPEDIDDALFSIGLYVDGVAATLESHRSKLHTLKLIANTLHPSEPR